MKPQNTPNSTVEQEGSAAIDAAAAAWAARADRAPLSDEDQSALEAWAAADPRRAGAYARARAVNAHFNRARGLGAGFSPEQHPIARLAARRKFLKLGTAIAASSLIGVVGFLVHGLGERITTRKGDIRRAPLSDGSAVTLNTDSAIRTDFSDKLRRVELLRGEALFDVAKEAARPFVVVAGEVRVRAVGTSFTVRTHADGKVNVLVREGVVEVSRGSNGHPLRLAASNAAQVESAGEFRALSVEPGAVDRAMAWRQGQIDLDGLTLSQAAAEFARYSDRRIRIDDPTVASLKVTGLFSATDPDGFAKAAALSLGLVATADQHGIRLSARGTP